MFSVEIFMTTIKLCWGKLFTQYTKYIIQKLKCVQRTAIHRYSIMYSMTNFVRHFIQLFHVLVFE